MRVSACPIETNLAAAFLTRPRIEATDTLRNFRPQPRIGEKRMSFDSTYAGLVPNTPWFANLLDILK